VSFSDPRWLSALFAVGGLLALEALAWRRAARAIERLAGPRREHALLLQRRPGDRRLSAVLRLSACALLAIGAAGPEWGREVVRRTATGSDVVFVTDVSASMDARDVAPSRLDEARREALAVLDHLEGSRVGVVAFAGDAVRLCPLTLDHGAVHLVLESLSSGSVSTPGTDVGKALRVALRVMPPGHRDEQAVVLWTDGEDLEQGARGALDEVVASGVRVFAVGCGTPAGDVVPVLDAQGRAVDVKRDAQGALVHSRLDIELLRLIARRTRGGYFAASRTGGETPRLTATLASLARSARGSRLAERPVARFRLFASLAALLLVIELGRPRRRREAEREAATPLHSERTAAAVAALAVALAWLLTAWAPVAHAQSAWARGDRAFRRGRWAEAESLYALRLRHGGPDAVRVNQATARARRGDRGRALGDLARLSAPDTPAGRTAAYNQGTLLGEQNEVDGALAVLRRELERDPGDGDARWNYEVLLRRRPQPHAQPPPQQQKGGGGGAGGGGSGNQQQQAQNRGSQGPTPTLPQSGSGPPPTSAGSGGTMSRTEADRLLGALEELARADQQHQRRVRVTSERRGRDW
jgi:Ca-activated chloride channel homolog